MGDEIFAGDHIRVRNHLHGEVAVAVGSDPESTRTTIVNAAELRDALDDFLGDTGQSADTTVTVDVDVADAIEEIERLEEAAQDAADAIERVDWAVGGVGYTPSSDDFSDDDYGTPAPSPDDVKSRIADTPDEDPRGDSDD